MPDLPTRLKKRGQASTVRRNCIYCSHEVNAKGIASHERACKKKKDDLEKTLTFLNNQRQELRDEQFQAALEQTDRALTGLNIENIQNDNIEDDAWDDHLPELDSDTQQSTFDIPNQSDPLTSHIASPPIDSDTGRLIEDAIKIVYHPNSQRAEEIMSLLHYRQELKVEPPVEKEPWLPFQTLGDYEFAEISLAASLNAEQNNALISLIHRLIRGESKFTVKNNTDLQNKWAQASTKLTDFKEEEFDVPYRNEKRTFKVYYRPIWDWILDLLKNPQVVPHFRWDARRLYKYQSSSRSYIRFYDEPWTADQFWNVQSEFADKETKPFSIIFYADKNKLSSFGTQKGYPVVVRCANLPVSIRNSDGIGGGIVLAWLPIVPENAQDSGKAGFANFKASVWHRAVDIIMRSIRRKSKSGYWVKCGDEVTRHICPHILIISADHEEQGIIALNRGTKGKKACCVCNHPTTKLGNLSINHSLRTAFDSKAYYELIKSFSTIKSKEFIMKLHGLRPVKNAFWKIGHTDVHRAISWDRLHAYHSGLFAAHIWPVFKSYFDKLGRSVEGKVDTRLKMFPRWRDLYHFDSAIKVTFNDGKKHEDLSRQLLYVIHDIFEQDEESEGYLFVRLFRKYLELDVYMSFDLHTEDSIILAENTLKAFGELLLRYILITEETSPKNWHFLKAHSHKHACSDIRAKGVTRNFNTKPNEKLHGPLRDIYHDRTNFRDVAPQILRVSHQNLVSTFIRSQLDVLDDKKDELEAEFEDTRTDKRSRHPKLLPPNDKFTLGAQQPAVSLAQIEGDYKDDAAFKDFRKRLTVYVNNFLGAYNIPLPHGKYFRLTRDAQIVEFRFLKVNYESLVTWNINVDYLRCTKEFFGKPRHDCVLLSTGSKYFFARLVFLFAVHVGDIAYPVALVQALDAYLGPPKRRDRELGLRRIGLKPRSAAEFVPMVAIIRGAVVVPVFEAGKENEYFVMDLIDGDMFLRCHGGNNRQN